MGTGEIVVDLFGPGLVLGLIIGGSLFASARMAIGLLSGTAVSVTPFVVTQGPGAFQSQLDNVVRAIGADSRLAVGIMMGFVLAGVLSVVYRNVGPWK